MKPEQYTIIVVPDGIATDSTGKTKNEVSFVYKAVLDFVIKNYLDSVVYLAPANNFGTNYSEQELAGLYLKGKGCNNYVIINSFQIDQYADHYIDTLGNAVLLKAFLIKNSLWPLQNVILVSSIFHAFRTNLCFKAIGFEIKKLEKIKYHFSKNDFIVKRLFYYKYKYLHIAYEILAFCRDFIRIYFFK